MRNLICTLVFLAACSYGPAPIQLDADASGGLLEQLAEARQTQIARLKAYAAAGKFPDNLLVPGETPCFIGANGNACAVGHLMIESGLRNEVDAIAKADNHVRVMDVHDGPMIDWILRSGLTQEECALIQPGYRFMDPEPRPVRLDQHFQQIVVQLERQTPQSLAIALDRLNADMQRLEGSTVANTSDKEMRVRVSALDRTGRHSGTSRWIVLAAGERREVDSDGTLFVQFG